MARAGAPPPSLSETALRGEAALLGLAASTGLSELLLGRLPREVLNDVVAIHALDRLVEGAAHVAVLFGFGADGEGRIANLCREDDRPALLLLGHLVVLGDLWDIVDQHAEQ